MRLTEILLTEVPGTGDPGPRSTRPGRLGVVAYVSATDGERGYVGGGIAVLPPGMQSPWNAPEVAEAFENGVRRIAGTRLPDDTGQARSFADATVARFAEDVAPHVRTTRQRAGLSCVDRALEIALLDLLARAGRGEPAAVTEAWIRSGGADAQGSAVPVNRPFTFELPGGNRIELGRDDTYDLDRGWRSQPPPDGLGAPLSLPRLICWMGRGAWARSLPAPDPWDAGTDLNEYASLGLETLGKNSLDSYLLEREAHRLGLRTVRFHGVDFQAEDAAGHSAGFHCTTGPSTSRYAIKVCGAKQVTRRILARAGVAVPDGRQFVVENLSEASAYARSLGWPVVTKPVAGKGGEGVTAGIADEAGLERALGTLADAGHVQILVEKHIPGADYRFFVVGDRVESVVYRKPAGVIGDGRSTVAELVLAKNLFRQRNPHLRSRLIRFDQPALRLLAECGRTPDSVPKDGEHVVLTTAANLTRGGDSAEVLDETHPTLLDMAVRAVGAVAGLDHAGVDFLLEDHRRPLDRQSGAICELNSLPGTTSHHYPVFGPSRNVSAALMKHYAGRNGMHTVPQPATISAELHISGKVHGVGYGPWLARLARQLGVTGWVRNADRDDLVEAEVTGLAELVSAISAQAVFGPRRSRPELVDTRVVEPRSADGFTVVR